MGWFRKKKDVIDFTKLDEQRALRKAREARSVANTANSSGVIDFTSSTGSSSTSDSSSSDTGAGALGFLSNLANVGSSNDSGGPYTERLREARKTRLGLEEVNHMKVKMEDAEYKLNRVIDRLEKVEEKLAAFERRVR